MLFSCFSNFSRAFIIALRTSNHKPCLQWDPSCVLGLFSDVVIICRTSLVFLSSFKKCLVLVILLCFTAFIHPSSLKSFRKFLLYLILIDCLYRQTYDINTLVIKHYAVVGCIMRNFYKRSYRKFDAQTFSNSNEKYTENIVD